MEKVFYLIVLFALAGFGRGVCRGWLQAAVSVGAIAAVLYIVAKWGADAALLSAAVFFAAAAPARWSGSGTGRKRAVVLYLTAALSCSAVFVVRTCVLRPVEVSGRSMAPTFEPGGRVWVRLDKQSIGRVGRGDVVVAIPKEGSEKDLAFFAVGGEPVIKRVLAIWGDTVFIDNEGRAVVIAGADERVPACLPGVPMPKDGVMCTIPAGHVFLAGDNVSNSADSRDYGPVPLDAVKGVALEEHLPPNKTK